MFRNGVTGAVGRAGLLLGDGLGGSLAVRLRARELQVFVAVVVGLATHASFFPNRALAPTSSFQGRCVGLKVCF